MLRYVTALSVVFASQVAAAEPEPTPADIKMVEVAADVGAGRLKLRLEISGESPYMVIESFDVTIDGHLITIPPESYKPIENVYPTELDIRSECGFTEKLIPPGLTTGLWCISVPFYTEGSWGTWAFEGQELVFWTRKIRGEDELHGFACLEPRFDSVCRTYQRLQEKHRAQSDDQPPAE